MRLLVFQHLECEHPGIFRQFLAEEGIGWDAIELDRGEPIPPLNTYDVLWIMGGPMDVWDIEDHPWLIAEKSAIRHWVRELQRPFLGVCLGHQLLADALGGTCGHQRPAEIGILDVELTEAGCRDPIFEGMAQRQKCLQWHSACVTQPPEGSLILAKSDLCSCQAMRIGEHGYSMQYHVELEPDTISNWGRVPAYAQALAKARGPGGLDEMVQAAEPLMENFIGDARRLYRNFMQIAWGCKGSSSKSSPQATYRPAKGFQL
jgi:GMP synthase-like glutamine amidotransferase